MQRHIYSDLRILRALWLHSIWSVTVTQYQNEIICDDKTLTWIIRTHKHIRKWFVSRFDRQFDGCTLNRIPLSRICHTLAQIIRQNVANITKKEIDVVWVVWAMFCGSIFFRKSTKTINLLGQCQSKDGRGHIQPDKNTCPNGMKYFVQPKMFDVWGDHFVQPK